MIGHRVYVGTIFLNSSKLDSILQHVNMFTVVQMRTHHTERPGSAVLYLPVGYCTARTSLYRVLKKNSPVCGIQP